MSKFSVVMAGLLACGAACVGQDAAPAGPVAITAPVAGALHSGVVVAAQANVNPDAPEGLTTDRK